MEKMKKALRKIGSILWTFLEAVIIVYVICITMVILLRNKFGYTQIEKLTFVTMQEDTYEYIDKAKEGDLLVVKSSKKIEVGDVIYYYININNQYVVKSGAVREVTQGETTALYILNDDIGTTVASTKVLGKESNLYPTWGTVLDILTSRFGFLFLVLLPIMIVFIYQIYEFVMVLKFEEVMVEKSKEAVKTVPEKTTETVKQEENVPETITKVEEKVANETVEEDKKIEAETSNEEALKKDTSNDIELL